MGSSFTRVAVGLFVALQLAGCATTPPEVQQAVGHTNQMMGQLQQELKQFTTARQASQARVLDVSRDIQLEAEKNRIAIGQQLRTREAAGDPAVGQLLAQAQGLSKGLADDDKRLTDLQQQIEAELVALLKPLPDGSSKLASASTALAVVGQDLSDETQLKETLAVLRAIRDNTRDNRKKLKDAMKN